MEHHKISYISEVSNILNATNQSNDNENNWQNNFQSKTEQLKRALFSLRVGIKLYMNKDPSKKTNLETGLNMAVALEETFISNAPIPSRFEEDAVKQNEIPQLLEQTSNYQS